MAGKPTETPSMCGTVRRKPQVAPEAVTMALFGPGVADIETANAVADASQARPSTATRSRRTAPRRKVRAYRRRCSRPSLPPREHGPPRHAGTKRGRKRMASTVHHV